MKSIIVQSPTEAVLAKEECYLPENILVGKDILELVSSAMYIDPLSLYREYIQNATDAIDNLESQYDAQISIDINLKNRNIFIRDTGAGISNEDFPNTMLAIGGSKKRTVFGSRGFRGVGRLAGLAYCRTLLFRSKSKEDRSTMEIEWDCVKFKNILRDRAHSGNIDEVIRAVCTVRTSAESTTESYFEVELRDVVRIRNDVLLNGQSVKNYLSQVGPVPFNPDFKFGDELNSRFNEFGISSGYKISLVESGIHEREPQLLYKPYKNEFSAANHNIDKINRLESFDIVGIDGEISGIGWIAHCNYYGTIPSIELIKGIRLRVGNIQVGDSKIVATEFPEPRFNSWCMGELHILSAKILPNGRRDNFEENTHYDNVLGQLQPYLKNISKFCRNESSNRQKISRIQSKIQAIEQSLILLKSGSLRVQEYKQIITTTQVSFFELEEMLDTSMIELYKAANKLKKSFLKLLDGNQSQSDNPLQCVPRQKRLAFQEILSIVYEVSTNKQIGNSMVDKILKQISAKYA